MTATGDQTYELVQDDPLVVLGRVDFPARAAPIVDELASDYPDARFLTVLSELDTDDDGALLEGIRPLAAEVIFTASEESHAADPAALAMRALESFGFGQDFVFTVPRLPDAIDYALEAIASARGWEGTAILILGDAAVIDQARRHLHP
jgi:folylpolyglutamate synthase/dihydropteroate synthase